ncbi:MAG: putative phospholipid ABC transporter-binding protein MlaD [Syntrophorhabdus sp. PtaU1.Bin153]|nr:MAG: putative phospholipid ABC transporter-binding protein MlaD [Syntrophorhabdus sp. PtaU1.Bin153]
MMKRMMTTEVKVGLLVLAGVVLLFYMSFRVEKFGFFRNKGYELSVVFDNAVGLDKRTPVYIAGVQVGNISEINLEEYKAKAALYIKKGVNIPVDSTIAIRSQGLLGDKYLEIIPGTGKQFLADKGAIGNVSSSPGFDQLFARIDTAAKNFDDTMGELKGIIGENEKANIKKSIENIQVASTDFRDLLRTNKQDINVIVSKSATISDRLDTIVKDVENGKGTLGLLVKDETLYNDAKEMVASLKSISSDIEQGEGTLGKLAKDDTLYVETEKAVKKVQKGAEGIQEMTPITILGTIFGFLR